MCFDTGLVFRYRGELLLDSQFLQLGVFGFLSVIKHVSSFDGQ